jgi:putative ABC transport system permease protein
VQPPEALGKLEPYQIIGVVKDGKYRRVNEETLRTAYVASGQDPDPWPTVHFEVRSDRPVEGLIGSIRSAITDVNPGVSLKFLSLETQVNESLMVPRVVALLSSVFGLLALSLAVIGLYGLTAYGVARRTSEIGIRIALGARQQSVIWLILRDVFVLLAVGGLLGLAASLAAGRLIASLLFGVRPSDPWQLAGAMLVLAVAATLAAYLPARRAARIDPMMALRNE